MAIDICKRYNIYMENIINHPKLNYRYSSESNTIFIDIQINFYREIYNEWDFSPLINRDLDDDLFEYLESCAAEIPKKYSLCIVFNIPEKLKDNKKEEKNIIGFQNYFKYQIRKLRMEQKNNIKNSVLYGFFGILLIFIAYFIRKTSFSIPFIDVIIEGFFIGGWVLFWELFSAIFFKQNNMGRRKYILTRLMKSNIVYKYISE